MTGALSAVGLTSTNGFTTTGTTTFNTNITLLKIYNLSPNSALPTETQLGGIINVTASAVAGVSSSTTSIVIKHCPLECGQIITVFHY